MQRRGAGIAAVPPLLSVQPTWTWCRSQRHSRRDRFTPDTGLRWWFFGAFVRLEAEQLTFGSEGWNVDRTHLSGSVHGFYTRSSLLLYLPWILIFFSPLVFFLFLKPQLLKCLGCVRGTFSSFCVSLDLDWEASTNATKCAKFSSWGKSDQINWCLSVPGQVGAIEMSQHMTTFFCFVCLCVCACARVSFIVVFTWRNVMRVLDLDTYNRQRQITSSSVTITVRMLSSKYQPPTWEDLTDWLTCALWLCHFQSSWTALCSSKTHLLRTHFVGVCAVMVIIQSETGGFELFKWHPLTWLSDHDAFRKLPATHPKTVT